MFSLRFNFQKSPLIDTITKSCRAVGHRGHMSLMNQIRGWGHMPPISMFLMKFKIVCFSPWGGIGSRSAPKIVTL